MKSLRLGKKTINKWSEPYIIAEAGVNHEGSLKLAKKLVDLAKKGGADGVKFQTYKANKLVLKKSPAYWDIRKEKTKNQYDLFKKYDILNKKDYIYLANYCKKKKIDFLSTPFDNEAVDFLNPLVKFYKIASADINNVPLLRKIGSKRKTVILSTGASQIKEIQRSIKILKKAGCNNIIILHCILNYPTIKANANLNMIKSLEKKFKNNIIGYSDHTLPDQNMSVPVSAYLLGARVIEKHFTFNKKKKGNDHYHSMDIKDLLNLKKNLKEILLLLGEKKIKEPIKSELKSIKHARRSIVSARKIYKNEKFTKENLTFKRPGYGISVIHWDKVLGKKALKNIEENSLILKEHIKIKL